MTEYDFSPEAYERAIRTQNRIARWVNDTNQHQPANPFVPLPGEHISAPTSPPPTIPDRTPPPQPPAQLPQQYQIYQPQQPRPPNVVYPGSYSPPQGVVSPIYVSTHKRHKSKRHHSKHGSKSLNPSPNKPPSIALPAAVVPIGNGLYTTGVQAQLVQPVQSAAPMMVRSPVLRSTSAPPTIVTPPYYFYSPQSPPLQQPAPGYAYGTSPYSGLQQMQAQSIAHAQGHPYQYSVGYISPLNSPPIQPVTYSPKGSKPRSIKSPKSSVYTPSITSTVSYVPPAPADMGIGGGFVFVGNGPAPNYFYGPPDPRSSGNKASVKEPQSFFGALGLTKKSSKKSSSTAR